jgi:hypothetical protein
VVEALVILDVKLRTEKVVEACLLFPLVILLSFNIAALVVAADVGPTVPINHMAAQAVLTEGMVLFHQM